MNKLILIALLFTLTLGVTASEPSIDAALAHPDRSDADRKRDDLGKTKQVLAFAEIKPGMVVADVFAGGGYFSELLSYALGPKGHVYCHNNKAWIKFLGDKGPDRLKKLPNISILTSETSDLQLPAGKMDLVMVIMGYHDVYYVDEGWPKVDVPAFIKQMKDALKPGGKLLILDHHAAVGTGSKSAQALHRIEKSAVRKDLEAAGFVFEAEEHFLENPADTLQNSVFDPSIMGKTSKFILRFKKP